MRVLSEADVQRLLDPREAIAASAEAYVALSEERAAIPLRTEILSPEVGRVVMVMPGLLKDDVYGVKVVASRTVADGVGPLTSSMMLIFDAGTLAPLGVIYSDYFTDYRTAAGLAAATDALAKPDATVHTVFGAGKLAGPSVRLVAKVRPITRVIVAGRSRARAEGLVESLRKDREMAGCEIELAISPSAAAEEADIITAVTSSSEPVFDGSVVRPGTHINIGGAFSPSARELDDHIAARAIYFVDSNESCMSRAGDIVIPLGSGILGPDRVRGEIGAVIAGRATGRRSDDEITIFKSLGNAAQDLILARRLIARPDLDARQVSS